MLLLMYRGYLLHANTQKVLAILTDNNTCAMATLSSSPCPPAPVHFSSPLHCQQADYPRQHGDSMMQDAQTAQVTAN